VSQSAAAEIEISDLRIAGRIDREPETAARRRESARHIFGRPGAAVPRRHDDLAGALLRKGDARIAGPIEGEADRPAGRNAVCDRLDSERCRHGVPPNSLEKRCASTMIIYIAD